MCGIAAVLGPSGPDERRRLLDRLVHRGPDDEGEKELGHAWLGHRRLSIVDVESGHQPLHDGEVWLVGNGEVYNHEVVRATLADTPFHTTSDNEVALHVIDQRGPRALGELEGMFAFVMAAPDGSFLAARDPVGIKPLYWARDTEHDRTVFASELASFDPELRPLVETFPPGHYWTPEDDLVRFAAVAPADEDLPPEPPSREAQRAATRTELIGAVERQMMGDVPVGVFLSGGLDSSLIAAIAARHLEARGEQLKTFAVGLEGSADLLAARVVSEHLGTEHHERVYTAEEALDAVPDVVRAIEHFDPSLVRSAVPNYLLAEMTVEHVKVVLTGEGADELFAGYEYMQEITDEAELHAELRRTIGGLHNLNLQRADRVTMAHGLEARVPFLDREMIAHALALPAEAKLAGSGRQEKWLLREAFEGWLPEALLWRDKQQFGYGSGAADALTSRLEDDITEEEFESERHAVDPPLRDHSELHYFRIFAEHLPGIRPERVLGRFATV
jgi:asparagine synthase (glutamine-hydrolysing)